MTLAVGPKAAAAAAAAHMAAPPRTMVVAQLPGTLSMRSTGVGMGMGMGLPPPTTCLGLLEALMLEPFASLHKFAGPAVSGRSPWVGSGAWVWVWGLP